VLSPTGITGGSHRWKNAPRLDTYLQNDLGGVPPVVDHETPEPPRLLAEMLMTGLRLAEGVERTTMLEFARMFRVEHRLLEAAKPHEDEGRLLIDGERWRVSASGLLVADGLASDLMAAVLDPL